MPKQVNFERMITLVVSKDMYIKLKRIAEMEKQKEHPMSMSAFIRKAVNKDIERYFR